ncbi:MAG: hypothetical protein ACFE8E_03120 [Candidatus Hodarchaeota archaeon]
MNRKSYYKKLNSNHGAQQSNSTFNLSYSSQRKKFENKSEEGFDWDWIFDRGWLRIKE